MTTPNDFLERATDYSAMLALYRDSKPFVFEIETSLSGLASYLLIGIGLRKQKHVFYLHDLKIGVSTLLIKKLAELDPALLSCELLEQWNLAANFFRTELSLIIAIAIRNYRGTYSRRTQDIVYRHFSNEDIIKTMMAVRSKMNCQQFHIEVSHLTNIN